MIDRSRMREFDNKLVLGHTYEPTWSTIPFHVLNKYIERKKAVYKSKLTSLSRRFYPSKRANVNPLKKTQKHRDFNITHYFFYFGFGN